MDMLEKIQSLFRELRKSKKEEFHRVLPFGDYFVDRWEKAKNLGFGDGSSVYDNVLVLGDVELGEKCWVGPNVVLDGSGGLKIGSYCSIGSGVQIYSHDTVEWTLSGGEAAYEYAATNIGDKVFLAPNSIVHKGVSIGDRVVVTTGSVVYKDVPSDTMVGGNPARVIRSV